MTFFLYAAFICGLDDRTLQIERNASPYQTGSREKRYKTYE